MGYCFNPDCHHVICCVPSLRFYGMAGWPFFASSFAISGHGAVGDVGVHHPDRTFIDALGAQMSVDLGGKDIKSPARR